MSDCSPSLPSLRRCISRAPDRRSHASTAQPGLPALRIRPRTGHALWALPSSHCSLPAATGFVRRPEAAPAAIARFARQPIRRAGPRIRLPLRQDFERRLVLYRQRRQATSLADFRFPVRRRRLPELLGGAGAASLTGQWRLFYTANTETRLPEPPRHAVRRHDLGIIALRRTRCRSTAGQSGQWRTCTPEPSAILRRHRNLPRARNFLVSSRGAALRRSAAPHLASSVEPAMVRAAMAEAARVAAMAAGRRGRGSGARSALPTSGSMTAPASCSAVSDAKGPGHCAPAAASVRLAEYLGNAQAQYRWGPSTLRNAEVWVPLPRRQIMPCST
jgi:hypothetical protein